MRVILKSIIAFMVTLLVSPAIPGSATQHSGRQMSASGRGRITVGQEEFELRAIVVRLLEDEKADIILISDVAFFVNGTWSEDSNAHKEIELRITGGITQGGVEGTGKLLLRSDGNADGIAKLTLEGSSNTRKKAVKVLFLAQ